MEKKTEIDSCSHAGCSHIIRRLTSGVRATAGGIIITSLGMALLYYWGIIPVPSLQKLVYVLETLFIIASAGLIWTIIARYRISKLQGKITANMKH